MGQLPVLTVDLKVCYSFNNHILKNPNEVIYQHTFASFLCFSLTFCREEKEEEEKEGEGRGRFRLNRHTFKNTFHEFQY